jgi:hypothetical protein
MYAVGLQGTSDRTLKTNFVQINNALDKIKKLNGWYFDWKNINKSSIGVIADEVEAIFPTIVDTNAEGIKSVSYNGLVGVLIEAIKEQQNKFDNQQNQIDELKSIIKNIK